MSLSMGSIDVNPQNVDPALFALPKIKGYPVWQMGTRVVGNELRRNAMPIVPRSNLGSEQQPGRVRITPHTPINTTNPPVQQLESPIFADDPPVTLGRNIQTGFQASGAPGSAMPFPGMSTNPQLAEPDFADD